MKLSLNALPLGSIGGLCALGMGQAWLAFRFAQGLENAAGMRLAALGLIAILGLGIGCAFLLRHRIFAAMAAMAAQEQAQQQRLDAAQRAEAGLDGACLMLMFTDADFTITGLNPAFTEMARLRGAEMGKAASSFSPDSLIGQAIDSLAAQPGQGNAMREGLARGLPFLLPLGGREFEILAWPARGPDDSILGHIVYWADRTEAQRMEQRLTSSAQALAAGDFGQLIPLEGKGRPWRGMAEALNCAHEGLSAGLTQAREMLAALAGADPAARLDGDKRGALETLKAQIQSAAAALDERIRVLAEDAAQLSRTAGQIQTGSGDFANSLAAQTGLIEGAQAAMEELTRSVEQNAARTQLAQASVSSAQANADQSAHVAQRATEAMGQIVDSSRRISEIISLIDDIAFQTNLLALNASVEAARAGEAGKGFAVVASEVRRLAQSAAQASAEVKTLIQSSSQNVRNGVDLVDRSAQSLRQIEQDVRDLSGLVHAIAGATQEQAAGLHHVHTAVEQMGASTQRAAALAEVNHASVAQAKSQAFAITNLLGASPGIESAPPRSSLPVFAARPETKPAPAPAAAAPLAPTKARPAPTPLPSPARELQTRVGRAVSAPGAPAKPKPALSARADDDWSEF